MHLSGCRPVGLRALGKKRIATIGVTLVVLLSVVVGTALLPWVAGQHSGAGATSPRLSHDSASAAPTIYSFSASPSEVFQGSSTSFFVDAYSPLSDPLAYSYSGLPSGCSSFNSSFLPCSSLDAGSFTVVVTVTDTSTLAVATARTPLYVDPVVSGTLFSVTPNVIVPTWLNFIESGLPYGTPWTVHFGSDAQTAPSDTLSFLSMEGTFSYTVDPVPGYDANVSTGTVIVGTSVVNISVGFFPGMTNPISFFESGLPAAQPWSVTMAGETLTSTDEWNNFTVPMGAYYYAVGFLTGYNATPALGQVFAYGPEEVDISFAAMATTAFNLTFSESGLPFGTPWFVSLNNTSYPAASTSLVVPEFNGTYNYTVDPVAGYVATPSNGSVTVAGADPAPIDIVFSAMPFYTVSFSESGLPNGTGWSVSVNGTVYSSSNSTVNVSLYNGSYSYNVGGSALSSVPQYSVGPQNGLFQVNGSALVFPVTYSPVDTLGSSQVACTSTNSPPFYQNFCSPEAQSPTLVPLGNGNVGISTELYTNFTQNTCPGASAATVARVGFGISMTGGANFSASRSLGNDSCQYLDAIEPSFAASGASVVGAFVEENSSTFASDYVARGADALGFLSSADNGATFGPVVTIDAAGNIALPSVAAFGSNVYVAFEDIANSTTPLPGGALPVAIELLYSPDGGLTWQGPYGVPGLNGSQQFTEMSPSLTVNVTGALALAYATNRTCLQSAGGGGCAVYGDSIVVSTSTTNGSSWQGPTVLAGGAGETRCYTGACYSGFFQSTPQVAAAFSPDGASIYVAYSATYDQGAGLGAANFNHTGLFAAELSGGHASAGAVVAPKGPTALRSFNPGIAVSWQGVFLTYLQSNETPGRSGLANSLSQWTTTAPLGGPLSWTPPTIAAIESFTLSGSVNSTRSSFPGFSSSVAFTVSGVPLIAFSVPEPPVSTIARSASYYYVNTTYPTSVEVGGLTSAYAPNTVVVTFTATGLPIGRPWQFSMDGVNYALTTPSIQVTNVPLDVPVFLGAAYQPGYWEVVANAFNETPVTFSFGETYFFPFEVWEGLEFATLPGGILPWLAPNICCDNANSFSTNLLYSPISAYAGGFWEEYNDYFSSTTYSTIGYSGSDFTSNFSMYWDNTCVNAVCGYTTPWYFPYGSTIEIQSNELSYNQLPPTYFTGSGAGSYTGPMQGFCFDDYDCPVTSGPITMLGPVNETLWFGNGPTDLSTNVTIVASGLPSTSEYFATLDATPLQGNASSPAEDVGVPAGAHTVSNIWATAATPGWEYFGSVDGPNPFVTPLESGVTLSFHSLVNVSSPPGVVSFQATNLSAGTTWSLTFNESTYSSTTSWINLTTHAGVYYVDPDAAASPSGTTGFVPVTGAENLSVTPGQTYLISYVPAYQVHLVAAPGGFVSVAGGTKSSFLTVWAAAGSDVAIAATTTPGYYFGGWTGTGSGAYSGSKASTTITVQGPVTETASFVPLPGARFNLTFVEAGLPPGAWWSVTLNGVGYSSNTSSLTVGNLFAWGSGASGQYRLTAPTVYLNSTSLVRYVPPPAYSSGTTVGTNGSTTPPVPITYTAQAYLELTASGNGAVRATYQNQPLGSTAWLAEGLNVTIVALPNSGAKFVGWQGTGTGAYSGPNATALIQMLGPIREVAEFLPIVIPPPATYTLTVILDTPVVPGTTWGVTFGGVGYTSTGTTLVLSGLSAGPYSMLVDTVTAPNGLVQYRATATDPVAYSVSANANLHVALDAYYWVSVSATTGGSVSPGSGFYANNSILYLVATANPGDSFIKWSGSGPGSYNGTSSTAAVIVDGPVTEVAQFQASGPTSTTQSIWSSPQTWIGLGAVGLVVGILAGFIVTRLSPGPAPPRRPPSGASPPAVPPPSGGSP